MKPTESTASRAHTLRAMMPNGGHVLALAVLLGTLAVVLVAWQYARAREVRVAEAEFIARTSEVSVLLRERLANYELVAGGGASLFTSIVRPTPRHWQSYVDGMNLRTRFPGIVGLGFAGYVPGGRLDDLQLEWLESGYGRLEVKPYGHREFYGPILYLEPKTPANLAAIGYDMYSEPVRHAAMQAARDTGEARLSGTVHLVQDGAQKSTGLLLYLPVYRSGDHPRTVAARRQSMQGWVYVPFRMKTFVQQALGTANRDARFRIFDVSEGAEELLFTTVIAQGEQTPAFRHTQVVERYGRHWRMEFDSPPIEVAVPGLTRLDNTLALGLFVALLMYAIAWMLARTEARAQRIAERMTEDFSRSEQRFRSAMQYSAIGKALLDSEGRITLANPALGDIVGRDAASLVGVRFDSLFEDEQPATTGGQNDRGTDGDGVYRSTRRLHREGGIPRHAQLTYAPVRGNVGEDIHGLVQVEDVTERLRAEARVHALNRTLEARVALRTRELSAANQELEAFAYNVSHDLRAPLRSIDGFSRILTERYGAALDDSGRDYLARVRKAAGRMGELIDAMLTMSRLTRSELKLERVHLSRIANELLEELQLGEEGRRVEYRITPGLEVVGDAVLLRNLLGNLLANAWKFTRGRDDARIEFGVESGIDHEDEFYVRDNGAGFAQKYVDKLFRPFQRLHAQADFAGHGIGLASVKRIVERHGGSIRAVGVEGEGATFYFTLPGGAD
ncbi:MAG: CHASE domain-containing sensor histidine kinase [Lysobacter sp.]